VAAPPPPARRRPLTVAAGVLALGALAWLIHGRLAPGQAKPSEDALLAAAAPRAPIPRATLPPQRGDAPHDLPAKDEGDDARASAEGRLERARDALSGYLAAHRYPPGARPLSEQPGREKPHLVPPHTEPLARPDKKLTDARVTLSQDRYFAVGDEAALLGISCATSEGPARCEVQSAQAHVAPSMPQAQGFPPAALRFYDDGRDGDREAGDGVVTAVFAPARYGFGGYHGPILIDVTLRVEGEEGTATFDLQYTPAAPARFTGEVREVMENGSLCLYVGLAVDKPGRYVLEGRVDDAGGEGFALLSFNDPLGDGAQEARMCVFGKLVRDTHAKSPFRLRDLEGFLLKENAYPDRELVPTREGPVYTTRAYAESQFSDAEWDSPDKQRYVKELQKDVDEAEKGLAGGN
jgi:hypothetical protein